MAVSLAMVMLSAAARADEGHEASSETVASASAVVRSRPARSSEAHKPTKVNGVKPGSKHSPRQTPRDASDPNLDQHLG
jgi:hypothetical protein